LEADRDARAVDPADRDQGRSSGTPPRARPAWARDAAGMTTPHPPASQSFRVACDEGRDRVDLDRAVRDDTYRMVVMNADGSGGVHTSTTLAVTLPHVAAVAATTAGVGLALLIGGLVVVLAGRRRRAATPPPLA